MTKQEPTETEFLQRHPLAYAIHRINHLYTHNRDISESGEVPFIHSPLFPFVLTAYISAMRIQTLVRFLAGFDEPPALGTDGHLFVMSSQSEYRTHTLLRIASELRSQGRDIILLCSPAAEPKQDEWKEEGYTTVSHRELHGYIGITRLFYNLLISIVLITRFRLLNNVELPLERIPICFNYLFLETIKSSSLDVVIDSEHHVHTFSPMPYLLERVNNNNIFVYQHGNQLPIGNKIMAAPFFTPLTYLLWGEPWYEFFEECAHPDSRIEVVGSPWYDTLAQKRNSERTPQYDVLFLSATQRLDDTTLTSQYEQLVENIVETCNKREYSLAIKLHPLESSEWYKNRDWDGYIERFDDIDDALLSARVSVTSGSTAFLESTVLGVPAIVANLEGEPLDRLEPISLVRFTNGPDVGPAIQEFLNEESKDRDAHVPIDIGNSTDSIIDVIMDKKS